MNNKGEDKEFLEWYDQFSDAIFRHAVFRLSDREKAKDITQEAFIRLWNYVSQGKEISNVRAFIYKITNNLIIDEYRRKEVFSLDQIREEQGFDIGDDARGTIEYKDEHSRLLDAIGKLKDKDRDVLTMRHIDGFSVKEIARITEETENVISVRIHRAIQKIKEEYEKHN